VRPSLTFWLAILGILAVGSYFVVPRLIVHGEQARIVAAHFDIKNGIKAALDQYKVDNGSYPKSLQDLAQRPAAATNWNGPYIDPPKLPVDPWGNPYIYHFPGRHDPNPYDLLSAGPDGKEGTSDDIVNWK
jgi:general secretion pathway protein G